jgi:haloalkane dehalogenase
MPDIAVLNSTIHYTDTDTDTGAGCGPTWVLLHGNPSSSHMWRVIAPRLGPHRVLAPDLIGMGQSGKPQIDYLFADHARYLDAWFDAMDLDDVLLVGHDWGGALACDWAARHPDRVRGLAMFETIIKPMEWADLSAQARDRIQKIRTDVGETMVLDQDLFIRQAYTGGVLTPVGEHDLQTYLAPYPTRESRRPILAWSRQLPLGGEPAELVERINTYDRWLATSADVPKLLITFEGSPTLLIDQVVAAWCAQNVASLDIDHLGTAGHHAAEDRPADIAAALARWSTARIAS